jgi:DNA-binding transcriptional MerR regulator
MSPYSRSPVYNLKAVLKETHLKPDVLRAWERRYDLPSPQRTPGGHRLYSEYDIETIKWLRSRQAEGLSISHAVDLWKEILSSGRDPLRESSLQEVAPFASSPLQMPTHQLPPQIAPGDTRLESLRQQWLEANLAFDGARADEVLNQAFAIFPVETVCAQILQQGISDVGEYWFRDQVSIQQEHFASAQAMRRLETLATATPRPTRQQTLLVGCPSGEMHALPVLHLSLLLARRGLKVVYLGTDIPLERMQETVAAIHPDLIILAAQQLATAATLRAVVIDLLSHGLAIAYGGQIFNRIPALRERIPAFFLGETLDEALERIERLLAAPPPFSFIIQDDPQEQKLAHLYQEKAPEIQLALRAEIIRQDLPAEFLGEANAHFRRGLVAALQLGNPAYLESDLEWVQRLLTGRHIPADRLFPYLVAQQAAITQVLGTSAAPITRWIDVYLARQRERSERSSSL